MVEELAPDTTCTMQKLSISDCCSRGKCRKENLVIAAHLPFFIPLVLFWLKHFVTVFPFLLAFSHRL